MRTLHTLTAVLAARADSVCGERSSTPAKGVCKLGLDDPSFCDECDLSLIRSALVTYEVFCNSILDFQHLYELKGNGTVSSIHACLQLCKEWHDCDGAYHGSDNCVLGLASGHRGAVASKAGYTGFVVQGASHVSTLSTVSSLSKTTVAVSVTAVRSAAPTYTASQCQIANISCPACNSKAVVDEHGHHYTVFCDNQLYSDARYSVQEWVTPQGCLLQCNRYSWCKGVTWNPQGSCQLARGQNCFPEVREGYTAFLPLAPSKTTSTPGISAYPPKNGYTPVKTTTPVAKGQSLIAEATST
jgi:hypothetical protein